MPPARYPIWIIVADGRSARILQQDVHGAPLVEAAELRASLARHARELKSSPPGRAFSSAGSAARHSMEPRTDPLVHEKQEFIRRVAELIDEGLRHDRFRRLVLVAPPRTLGELRARIGEAAARLICAEVPHDYVATPTDELPSRLDIP